MVLETLNCGDYVNTDVSARIPYHYLLSNTCCDQKYTDLG